MAGYSSTPLWKKLGYKPGMEAYVEQAPSGYAALLQLPPEVPVRWSVEARKGVALAHLFCREAGALPKQLKTFRKLMAPDGVIWVSWPKKASGVQTDLSEDVVRNCALPLGLVDIKVCAVDDVWSGLKLMIRKTER
jgi:hypothetical protein